METNVSTSQVSQKGSSNAKVEPSDFIAGGSAVVVTEGTVSNPHGSTDIEESHLEGLDTSELEEKTQAKINENPEQVCLQF